MSDENTERTAEEILDFVMQNILKAEGEMLEAMAKYEMGEGGNAPVSECMEWASKALAADAERNKLIAVWEYITEEQWPAAEEDGYAEASLSA